MNIRRLSIAAAAIAVAASSQSLHAADPMGSLDPDCVVEKWSDEAKSPKIIDINFSDTSWPDTWGDSGSGIQCPEYKTGRYVNAIISVPTSAEGVEWPVMFHNCIFATTASNGGTAAATAAFARQYYEGQKATNYNNWKSAGHTTYLEDNIRYEGSLPVYGEAGFVQMCRNAAEGSESLHGWMQVSHIPYIERIQWSWSSTSWGRGIKCDIRIGDGEWKPLVWMGSEKQKQGWTVFADQGYFMENVIDASDVSLRWRVWDGDGKTGSPDQVQTAPFDWQAIDPMAQRQAPRVHKLRIFGTTPTAAQADYARNNPGADPGELTDLSEFGFSQGGDDTPAPDEKAPVVLLSVSADGKGDYTTVQAAIDAVPAGARGIIFIAPGVYEENIYAGTKENRNKFISLIGADRNTTILTSSVSRGSGDKSYLDCSALNVFTERFYAENLTIRNTAGNVGQAEALYTAADAHLFRNCNIAGYQDTYKANSGARGYFANCTVSGATDFIYDGGLEWFEDCEIAAVAENGYITAPAESSMPMTRVKYPELSTTPFYPGLFFRNCTLTSPYSSNTFYLGRPWKETCGAMFIDCTLGSHIAPKGWKEWNGTEAVSSLFEYRSTDTSGRPVDTSARASFSHQATQAEVEAYMTPEFLFSAYSKVPFDYKSILAGVGAPRGFTASPGAITWEADPQAAGWVVYLDGQFAALTTEPYMALAEGKSASDYSVAAISRHGVTSAAVKASEAMRLKAFPTAEGFGKYATGGRGGEVVTVTSLADDGTPGTLRWAFAQHKGKPLTIVFAVTGEIALRSELRINRSDWTLAGQSAPGQGIVITHAKVNLGGSQNFIVRNVRFRIGQKSVDGNIMADNALGAENCANFIFDHCTFGWSVEENMNTADSHFLTVQNSIVHEGLYDAGHSKGARGYGCQWGGSPATYIRNLLINNNSRSPRFNGARGEDNVVFMEYINNVNYNYSKEGACYGGENTAEISSYNGLNSAHECNFIGNYYKPGPNSSKSAVTFVNVSYARDGAKSWGPSKWYVAGNKAEGFPAVNADNWKGMKDEHYSLSEIRSDKRIVTATPYYKYTPTALVGSYVPEEYMVYDIMEADEAMQHVSAFAGPVKRDAVEDRLCNMELMEGKHQYGNNGIIDTEHDAEGFISYPSATAKPDTDGDGMPDEWEKQNGLDPDKADHNKVNSEGYTALEVYLNSLMGEPGLTDFRESGIADVTVAESAIVYHAPSATLTCAPELLGSTLTVYGTDGRVQMSRTVVATATSLGQLPGGIYIVRVSSRTHSAVLKIRR